MYTYCKDTTKTQSTHTVYRMQRRNKTKGITHCIQNANKRKNKGYYTLYTECKQQRKQGVLHTVYGMQERSTQKTAKGQRQGGNKGSHRSPKKHQKFRTEFQR